MRGVEKTALGQLLRLELELGSPFGGLTANEKSIERLALLAGEALEAVSYTHLETRLDCTKN